MWFESQNCAMMGVQATCGKRKLEVTGAGSPCKAARWDAGTGAATTGATSPVTPPTAGDDCLARLRAVAAVPVDCGAWRAHPHHVALTAVTAADEPLDDDDDWDDELSDYDEPLTSPSVRPPYAYWPPPPHPPHQYYPPHHHHHHHQQHLVPLSPLPPPQQLQTITREENGKSYLELGTPTAAAVATANGVQCYRQRRLAVLNMSMCKLARYRQCSDPSLRRSVLICNTLRRIEREMEREGHHQSHQQQQHQQWYQAPDAAPPPSLLAASSDWLSATNSGRATPFPQTPGDGGETPDSGYDAADDRANINWGSVLSLTQTVVDPLNNNLELYLEDPTTAPPSSPPAADTWDSFVHVLVSGT